MVSLRFPFSFSQPTPPSNHHPPKLHAPLPTSAALAAAAAVGFGVGFASSHKLNADTTGPPLRNPWHFFFSSAQNSSFPFWGSLSLARNLGEPAIEPKTGVSFPASLNDSQQLLGVGVRKKSVLGLKNIDVYAFGEMISPFTLVKLAELRHFDKVYVCFDDVPKSPPLISLPWIGVKCQSSKPNRD
ncbi:hypothetical protein ACLOJK_028819 [Asimina triloba]